MEDSAESERFAFFEMQQMSALFDRVARALAGGLTPHLAGRRRKHAEKSTVPPIPNKLPFRPKNWSNLEVAVKCSRAT